jgi:hypothetical protein
MLPTDLATATSPRREIANSRLRQTDTSTFHETAAWASIRSSKHRSVPDERGLRWTRPPLHSRGYEPPATLGARDVFGCVRHHAALRRASAIQRRARHHAEQGHHATARQLSRYVARDHDVLVGLMLYVGRRSERLTRARPRNGARKKRVRVRVMTQRRDGSYFAELSVEDGSMN